MNDLTNTTVVDTKQLKELLFSNVYASGREAQLVRKAQNRLFSKCTIDGVFRPALYSATWRRVHIVLKGSELYNEVDDAFKNFNPLNEDGYEFLAEKDGEYAIICTI